MQSSKPSVCDGMVWCVSAYGMGNLHICESIINAAYMFWSKSALDNGDPVEQMKLYIKQE